MRSGVAVLSRLTMTGRPDLRTPDDPGGLAVALGSLGDLRDAVARRARGCGLPEDTVSDLIFVANELATNVVRHGGGTGRLRLWCAPGAMYCEVSDHGSGMAKPEQAGIVPLDPLSSTGRGLWLVRRICPVMQIDSGPRGTTVTVAVLRPA
jgi:anti-sigma regulatory factor (Ser/Thr protein kinase)